MKIAGSVLGWTVRGVGILVGVFVLLWAVGALWFDLPVPEVGRKVAAGVLFVGVVSLSIFGRRRGRVAAGVALALVVGWWFMQRPASDRPWQPDVAQTGWAEINGDEVTLHNVRNFEYRTATDFTPRWETRTVRLSQITGIDLGVNFWGSSAMAHPLVSFQFADTPPVCFSIETRREIGEEYSAIGGFYRQYELIYIVADERDVVRVRTNAKGEDVYLYRLATTPERARTRFLDYITTLNELHKNPRWYNAATENCTTSIRNQRSAADQLDWDWRILVNGYGDEMLFEKGLLQTGGLPFAELKKRALINETARAANDDPDFSTRIRSHLPASAP